MTDFEVLVFLIEAAPPPPHVLLLLLWTHLTYQTCVSRASCAAVQETTRPGILSSGGRGGGGGGSSSSSMGPGSEYIVSGGAAQQTQQQQQGAAVMFNPFMMQHPLMLAQQQGSGAPWGAPQPMMAQPVGGWGGGGGLLLLLGRRGTVREGRRAGGRVMAEGCQHCRRAEGCGSPGGCCAPERASQLVTGASLPTSPHPCPLPCPRLLAGRRVLRGGGRGTADGPPRPPDAADGPDGRRLCLLTAPWLPLPSAASQQVAWRQRWRR